MADIAADFTLSGSGGAVANLRTNPLLAVLSGTGGATLAQPTFSQSLPPIRMGGAGSGIDLFIPRTYYTNPFSKTPKYRLIVVDKFGTRFGELDHADIASYGESLNESGDITFSLGADDPKVHMLFISKREVQVWRGGNLECWYSLIRARGAGDSVTFTGKEPDWFLGKRVMGLAPMPNLVTNGGFEMGEAKWNFSFVPGSIPSSPPIHRLDTDTISGGNSLYIEGSSAVQVTKQTLSSDVGFAPDAYVLTDAGKRALDSLVAKISVPNPTMRVEGHTDSTNTAEYNYTLGLNRANSVKAYLLSKKPSAIITAVSYGETRPIATNSTSAGRALNRRVDISYSYTQTAKGHKQYAGQSFTIMNPVSSKKEKTVTFVGWTKILQYLGPSKEGYGIYMQLVDPSNSKVVKYAAVPINAETPRDRWTRMECSMGLPADGKTYRVDIRLYPPEGKSLWDEITVTQSEQLAFYDIDQALIIKGLVEHAQDPAMGKNDLNISTNTPLTGVKRTREYPWIERMPIIDAVNEFMTLADGVDVSMAYTATTRTMTTHYPRQGVSRGYVFALGSNVIDFDVDFDAEQIATRIIVQSEGEGSDREEGVYTDTTNLDGEIVEKVYNATPNSPISSLLAQAKRGVQRYARPVIIPSVVMSPKFTDELLDNARIGDVVRVVIKRGWIDIDAPYRITERRMDPKADQLTYTITPEDY